MYIFTSYCFTVPYISPGEIVSLLKNVESDIYDVFGYKMTDADYNSIAASLIESDDLKEYRIEKILRDADMAVSFPYMLLSPYPLIVTGILCLLLFFDIFLFYRKKPGGAFLTAGIPLVLSGLPPVY